ncbi:MAG: hypothetical protein ABI776_13900 [Nocardioidaceae bacterium]
MSDLRRTGRLALAVLVVFAAVAVVVGVLLTRSDHGGISAGPSRPPIPSPSPDLSALAIERAPFCDRLDKGDVREALAAPVTGADSYRSGERVLVAPGVADIAHELDCTFHALTGVEARVWVFAQPVTRSTAVRTARDVRRARGCRPLTGAPAYGTPSGSTVCPAPTPYGQQVTLRGLFGDAWLSCQLTTSGTEPRAEVVTRAERWCVQVATTLGSRP